MRRIPGLVVLGLAVVALATTGCATSTEALPPGAIPMRNTGVVEIYRNDPTPRLVGYVSIDAADPSLAHWLLNYDESPPVLGTELYSAEYIFASRDPKNGDELCAEYCGTLDRPKIWRTFSDPPMDCLLLR